MKEFFTTVKEGVQALVALSLVGVIAAALVWPDTVGKRFGEAAQGFARSAGGDVKLSTPLGDVSIKVEGLEGEFSNSTKTVEQLQNDLAAMRTDVATLKEIVIGAPVEVSAGPDPGGPSGGPAGGPGEGRAGPVPVRDYDQRVVFAGADREATSQSAAAEKLRAGGIAVATVLKVGALYRAAAVFPDGDAAEAGRERVQALAGDSSYPSALSVICPAHRWIDPAETKPLYICN